MNVLITENASNNKTETLKNQVAIKEHADNTINKMEDEWCWTRELRLYEYSFTDMYGDTYDVYTVYTTTTCYFVTPPCSIC